MSDKFQYSIIYGVIRPEIAERLSLGLIIVDNNDISVKYSVKKLDVFDKLVSREESLFVGKVLRNLKQNKIRNSADVISYISRYSNNLINVSPLESVDLSPTKTNTDWLYKSYVYNGER